MTFRVAGALAAMFLLGAIGARAVHAQATITCESMDNSYRDCRINTNGSVRLERQISSTPCVYGKTWGFDYNSVWVDRGCRGLFAAGGSGSGWNSGNSGQRVTCSSINDQYQRCSVPTRGDVRLVKQLSKDACIAGNTWGFQNDFIWVRNGCRAEFQVGYYDVDWNGGNRTITCESDDNNYRRCRTWTYGTVRVQRQLSKTTCSLNRNWGYDREGIWVKDGCRAVFNVGAGSGGWGDWGGNQGGGGNYPGGNTGAVVSAGRQACQAEASRMGYRSVAIRNAHQSGNDVEVEMSASNQGQTWTLKCKYRPNQRKATIYDQSSGSTGGTASVSTAQSSCSTKARSMGYQVQSMGTYRVMSEAIKVYFVLTRNGATYPQAECNYILRDKVSTVAPGSPARKPR